MTTLKDIFKSNRSKIVENWLVTCLEIYPADSRGFFSKKKNRFSNPVGASLAGGLESFVDGLILGEEPAALCARLEEIVRIRSVHQAPPSKSLSFVFELKEIVRAAADLKDGDSALEKELNALMAKLDETGLRVFDMYMGCRERVFDIRVNDVKRQVSSLLRRTSFFNNDEESSFDSGTEDVNLLPGEDVPGR